MNEEKAISTACPSLKLTYGMRASPSGHHRNVSTGTVIINITVFTVLSLLLCPPLHDALIILVLIFSPYSPFCPMHRPPPPYRSLRQPHGSRVNSHCSSPRGDTGQSNIRVTDQKGEHSPPPYAHTTAWIRCMSTPCPISLPPPPLPSTFSGTHSTGHCPNAWYPHWLSWPQGPQHGAITRIMPPCLITSFSACTSSARPPHTLTPDPRGCG